MKKSILAVVILSLFSSQAFAEGGNVEDLPKNFSKKILPETFGRKTGETFKQGFFMAGIETRRNEGAKHDWRVFSFRVQSTLGQWYDAVVTTDHFKNLKRVDFMRTVEAGPSRNWATNWRQQAVVGLATLAQVYRESTAEAAEGNPTKSATRSEKALQVLIGEGAGSAVYNQFTGGGESLNAGK